MFIIIDSFPHEAVWRSWLEMASSASRDKVRILIHAKFPDRVTSPWVKRHLCKTFQLSPSWGSLELTDVMVRLLEEAVRCEQDIATVGSIPLRLQCSENTTEEEKGGERKKEERREGKEENGAEKASSSSSSSSHFVFVSESCVPVCGLDRALATIAASSSPSSSPCSWLQYTDKATNGYAQQQQFAKLQGVIPAGCLYVSLYYLSLYRSLPSLSHDVT